MEMKQCEQGGHFYDATIHSSCPYCNEAYVGATQAVDTGRTVPLMSVPVQSEPEKTVIAEPAPVSATVASPASAANDGRTIAIIKEEIGADPVVGWLVVTEGDQKGRDFRIHSDNNFIGRSESMDICIPGDDTISREKHATIIYDSREKSFFFAPGDGRSIVRVNDKHVLQATELKAHDTIEIGRTKLIFMPLCGQDFDWV